MHRGAIHARRAFGLMAKVPDPRSKGPGFESDSQQRSPAIRDADTTVYVTRHQRRYDCGQRVRRMACPVVGDGRRAYRGNAAAVLC